MKRRVATTVAVAVALLGVLAGVLALVGTGGTGGEVDSAPAVASGGGMAGRAPADALAVPDVATPELPGLDGTVPGPEMKTDDARSAPVPAPGAPPADVIGRDVVRTAQLTLQVPDPVAAGRSVRTAVAAAGGVVAEEQADTTGTWMVVRVPAAGLDRLVDDLAASGTVLGRSGSTQDATEVVVDLDARVATQQASVTRVRALLAQATSIGDVVAVESELARREADLESLQRRLAALRDRVALSTLTVELRAAPAVAPDAPPPGFGAGLGAGWAGVKTVAAALATAAGFVVPFLPAVALVAGAVWLVVRRRRAGRGRTRTDGKAAEAG